MVSKQPGQADDEIHVDQLLNFPVNALTGAFGLNLGANADIVPKTSTRSSLAFEY